MPNFTIKAGTVVKINGIPVEILGDVEAFSATPVSAIKELGFSKGKGFYKGKEYDNIEDWLKAQEEDPDQDEPEGS